MIATEDGIAIYNPWNFLQAFKIWFTKQSNYFPIMYNFINGWQYCWAGHLWENFSDIKPVRQAIYSKSVNLQRVTILFALHFLSSILLVSQLPVLIYLILKPSLFQNSGRMNLPAVLYMIFLRHPTEKYGFAPTTTASLYWINPKSDWWLIIRNLMIPV